MSGFAGNSANKKQKLAPVQVYLRIRPKHNEDGREAIEYCTPKEIQMKEHLKRFTFDQIFDENTSQVKVYKTVVNKMITDVTKGYNCTIFAYGQTGTGKTYTIIGDNCCKDELNTSNWHQESGAGIILRAAMHLYEELDKLDPNIQRTVTVSFMEIYNEEIRDLLSETELTPLRIYEDKIKSVHVKNLQEVTVLSATDIIRLLKKGCEKRQVASTWMNKNSSRSHTVFTISVSTMYSSEKVSDITCGKLNLIDLAGSENIAKSGSKEQRAREATNINQSLLTLGRVIKALVESSPHVPYRESKLTRILQDSLGGKANTSIIATVSPGMASLEETLNTLDYAHNARNIKNCPTINLRSSDSAAAVQEEIQRLKKDLFAMANEQGVYMDKDNYNEMTQSLTQCKKEIANKHEMIRRLNEHIEDLEAQKHEWENLKESFEKTNQALQLMKSEIKKKQEDHLRDGKLLEYYKSESMKFREIIDLLSARGNCLDKKLDHIYHLSSKNQNLVDIIINKIGDHLVSQIPDSFYENIHALLNVNEILNNIINNVINQLKKSCTSGSSDKHEFDKLENHSAVMLEGFFESTDSCLNKFKLITENCSKKIGELESFIETKRNCLFEIRNSCQEEEDEKVQFKALLKEDDKNYKILEAKMKKLTSDRNTLLLEFIEDRKREIHKNEMRIKKMEHMLKNYDLEKTIEECEKNRVFENFQNVPYIKHNMHQKIENISSDKFQNLERFNTNADVQNSILSFEKSMTEVLDNISINHQKQNLKIANELKQSINIHSVQRNAYIEIINESLCTIGERLKKDVRDMYKSSIVPITHAGDTPKPIGHIGNILKSDISSATRNLFPNLITEEQSESQ